MKLQILTMLVTSAISLSVLAVDVYSDEYSTIKSVELKEVVEDAMGNEILKDVNMQDFVIPTFDNHKNVQGGGVGEYIMAAREIIAFGKEVYQIIEAGKPVVSIGDSVPLSVLPKDEKGQMVDAFQLHSWQMPKAKKYKVECKNLYGMTTISFEFMLIYTYGGKYNGKGAYITGAEVASTGVEVSWGYSLDASFKVQSIFNQGTKSSPVAAAVVQIDYTIKTVLKETRSSQKFLINGKGQTQAY